ncbi:unnamed protein product [Auanema sp. JU1783]|nr:unnamed protein product [Auanema sp. JU1783]
MAKYCLKKASKRVSCAKRYKIEKKVRQHNKKQAREAKKSGLKKRAEKIIPVPNSCPFKEDILIEAEKTRERIKAQNEAKKEALKALQVLKKSKPLDIASLAAKATKQGEEFEIRRKSDFKINTMDDRTIRAYASEVRKTIEIADVIIQVLDARDPLGSRSQSVEEQVIKGGKRLVFLLNKIDLVPKENVSKWLAYFRGMFPTIAFKASTQDQKKNLGRFNSSNLSNSGTSKCIGADLVMKLLGNYCRNKDIKTSIRVGVVGFPNVGKSSVINSLKRTRACNVGATPGITKELQEIELDKNIRLLDSPGVVLISNKDLDPVEVALRNAVKIDSLLDPVAPVHAILRRCSKDTLMLHFGIATFTSVDQFLALLARKLGKLKRGARPDTNAAAKHVLNHWNTGKLRYFTHPPETSNKNDNQHISTEIVSTFSKEFDIDSLFQEQNEIIQSLPEFKDDSPDFTMEGGEAEEDDDEEDEENEMEVDGEKGTTVVTSGKRKKKEEDKEEKAISDPTNLKIDGNVQLNRFIKKAVKGQKKKQKKLARKADGLADYMEGLETM